MHQALRSSLLVAAIAACVGCQTHDRRVYTAIKDKNLHAPNPYAVSTTQAAAEATAPLGGPGLPDNSGGPSGPAAPPQ